MFMFVLSVDHCSRLPVPDQVYGSIGSPSRARHSTGSPSVRGGGFVHRYRIVEAVGSLELGVVMATEVRVCEERHKGWGHLPRIHPQLVVVGQAKDAGEMAEVVLAGVALSGHPLVDARAIDAHDPGED